MRLTKKQMKQITFFLFIVTLTSCTSTDSINRTPFNQTTLDKAQFFPADPPIIKSLFNDKSTSISEENIQIILEGNYSLPNDLRVSIVKLGNNQSVRDYNWVNEAYLKSQQAYLDKFVDIFEQSNRIKRISVIPDILVSNNPTFTNIREAAVRTQSDIVVIYSINSNIYSKYRLFAKSDIKAFATIQFIIMDVRTGLIPFSTIVTNDFQSKKQDDELNENETVNRIKSKAVLLTIEEIGDQINSFFKEG